MPMPQMRSPIRYQKLSFFILFFGLFFVIPQVLFAVEYAGPETCAACHEEIYTKWKSSLHAKAYSNESFKKSWKSFNQKPDCLRCHTTGPIVNTTKFAHAGVSCESCHGAMSEGHPGENKMPIPVGSDMCKSCHKKTFDEWKISKHGGKGIRCFDCHNIHAQGLRAGGGDKLCGSCHSQKMEGFAHATHHKQGLECATCHMPNTSDRADRIQGTGSAGHTLSVGADVCTRCHEDTVHTGGSMSDLREKVTTFEKQMTIAGVENVYDLNEEVKTLKWQLSRTRQSVWVVAVLVFLMGLLLGWLGAWFRLKRMNHHG